ncbi:MAG: hypothetical protein H7235_11305 [Bdellovibrionaceae bacterium]|nr:hypothetical protein [Pseudobdellovibrionaceae bacterium]
MKQYLFKIIFLSLIVPICLAAPFQMGKDDLCFLNKDPELARFGFLGKLGAKDGVCQGIAGLSKIYFENVEFRPNEPMDLDVDQKIIEALKTYRQKKVVKILIRGYDGLNTLCKEHRDVFLQQSIDLNLQIAVKDISLVYAEFNSTKDTPISTPKQQSDMHKTIQKQIQILKSGHSPMILVYSHVMLVLDIHYSLNEYIYTYYDSNYLVFRTRSYKYGADGLPLLGQKMLWDITLQP